MIKTFVEIVQELLDKIKERFGDALDLRVGTIIRDCFITPFAYVISVLYENVSKIINSLNIITAEGEDLDRLASFYGIDRKEGTQASGIVRFYVLNPIGTIEIPINTSVYAYVNGEKIEYKTIQEGFININSLIEVDPLSPFKDYYYVDLPVVCIEKGTKGNVPKGSIKYIDISGVDGVYNLEDFNNAIDEQDDNALRQSLLGFLYSKPHSIGGYLKFVYDNSNVYDVKVFPSDDPDSFAPYLPGHIDIFCITDEFVANKEVAVAKNIVEFLKKPVNKVISVNLLNEDNSIGPVIQNYSLVKDTSTIYRYSYLEDSFLSINDPNVLGKKIVITYEYYKDIYNLQMLINSPENKIIGSNVIFRYGEVINPFIYMMIKPKIGYAPEEVANNIKQILLNWINFTKFGEKIDKTDIIDKVYVESLDYISEIRIRINNTFVESLIPRRYQYIRIKEEDISIDFVT